MQNSVDGKEKEFLNSQENFTWLSETMGIGLVEIHGNNKVILNSVAKRIFRNLQSPTSKDALANNFIGANSFLMFLENTGDITIETQVQFVNQEDKLTVYAKKFTGNIIQILFVLHPRKENAVPKELLVELERHESQLEITVAESMFEISRLNEELRRYKEDIEAIIEHSATQLKETEERLNTLSDNLPDGAIFRFSFDTKTDRTKQVYAGKFIQEIFGDSWNEFSDKQEAFSRIAFDADKHLFHGFNKKLANDKKGIDIEFRIIDKEGKINWLNLRAHANTEAKGHIYWDGFLLNYTHKKKLESNLQLAQTSIDRSKDPIYWFGEDAKIIFSNRAASELLGYTQSELENLRVIDISEGLSEENWPRMWQHLKSVKTNRRETNHLTKQGVKVPVEVKANFHTYENQEIVFVVASDISARKKAKQRIKYLQQFESLIVEISTRFINISYDEVNQNINSALQDICNFSKTDLAYIYIFEGGKNNLVKEYFCSDKKLYQTINKEQHVDIGTRYFQDLLSQGLVQVHDIGEFNSDNFIISECRRTGIRSFTNVALFYQNTFLGYFGVSNLEVGKVWEKDEMRLLQVVGDIFTGAVQRKQTVESLHKSEQTYREIYNASSETIIIHELGSGKIIDVNQSMLDMFCVDYNEALKLNLSELWEGPEPEEIHSRLTSVNEVVSNFEWISKKQNGEKFWSEVSIKKAKIHGHNRIISIVRDISNRKKSEMLLKENEEKYRMIVEGQNDLIVKVDTEGKFLFVSLSYCRMFNKSEEELIGNEFIPLVHEDDRESTMLAMEKLFKPPYSCYMEQRARTKDGWRWLAWNDTAVLDENNNVKEIIGIGRDITYQKMVENALRESEERFRSIVQNLSDVVFLLDEKATIKYVTPSSDEYLGIPVEELLGVNLFELIHSDDKWLAEENIAFHVSGNDFNIPYELRIRHKNGAFRMFEVKSQSMLKHPAVYSIIYTISDITERKLMEKQVLDAIIKTEEKERERFAKDLHDDLGPLLSSIKMYVGMLGKTKDEAKQNFIVNNLNDIVKEAISTTKDVSNDLNPHVLNNYGLVSALELYINKISTNTVIDFQQNIENTRYNTAIELSVYRISKELINNSIKHSNATKISLKLEERKSALYIYYEDNGKGINDSALIANKHNGMGLSNIISRAKSLNGSYNFHTNIENGFQFDLNVPLIQE